MNRPAPVRSVFLQQNRVSSRILFHSPPQYQVNESTYFSNIRKFGEYPVASCRLALYAAISMRTLSPFEIHELHVLAWRLTSDETFLQPRWLSLVGGGPYFISPHNLINPFYKPIIKFPALVTYLGNISSTSNLHTV